MWPWTYSMARATTYLLVIRGVLLLCVEKCYNIQQQCATIIPVFICMLLLSVKP